MKEITFVDDFNRPNSTLGLGDGWDMRGGAGDAHPIQLPPARDGFIESGRFTYAGDSAVYAARQLRGTVRRVGAVGRFRSVRRGAETTLAMAISPNDKLITDMIKLAANRSVWDLTVRRENGAFARIARGRFSPVLSLDRTYEFEFEVTDDAVTVHVPGSQITKQAFAVDLLGDHALWQEYPSETPAGIVFDFDTVWATEEGQPPLLPPR